VSRSLYVKLRPVERCTLGGGDTNDTKMETTAETVETVADVLNVLEARINTSYNR
jgi:hypothetical protein